MAWPRRQYKRVRRAFRRPMRALSLALQAARRNARLAYLALLMRVLPGRSPRRHAAQSVLVLRDLATLRALLARRPELQLQITCSGRVDGAGGQALSIMSALAFARNHRCRYLHTPLRNIAHVDSDPGRWAQRWEDFFGFGQGEEPLPADAEVAPLSRFARLVRRDPGYGPGPRTVVESMSFGYGEMSRPDSRRPLMATLRAKYHGSDKSVIPVFRMAGALAVAIHVRRGDVGPRDPRYEAAAPILRAIAQVRAVLASIGRAATFNLFSEGTPEQFQPFSAAGCALHLGGDPFTAFHNLVAADLLITTDSAFSRSAAMLSEGIVIVPTDKWGIDERWLARAADGSVDGARLAALLAAS